MVLNTNEMVYTTRAGLRTLRTHCLLNTLQFKSKQSVIIKYIIAVFDLQSTQENQSHLKGDLKFSNQFVDRGKIVRPLCRSGTFSAIRVA